jgi:prolyl-tRNA synthetase
MRWSNRFIPTLREKPRHSENASHSLSIRAGLIRPLISGVYSYLPLGQLVLSRIMEITREEMNRIGAQELSLPSLSPGDLWKKTGRWEEWGEEMFKFKDRKNRDLCLAPSHEEIIAEIACKEIQSYKNLPQIWYQVGAKYRDEPRPRGGVLRVREFIMKDSYSMDTDMEGLKKSYELHRQAYCQIFKRCGLDFEIVQADSGVMGGGLSEEFMVPSPGGEDSIAVCKECDYRASFATARTKTVVTQTQEEESLAKVHTPVKGTVDEISKFLKVPKSRLMKSLLFFEDKEAVFVLLRGDHELSTDKLATIGDLRIADPGEIKDLTGAEPGYISPIGLSIRTIADHSLHGQKGLITGANEDEYHYTGVDTERDLQVDQWIDVEIPNPGDPCAECGAPLMVQEAIEIGHIFNLGTKYSIPMGAYFLDDKGKRNPIIMGSYGIGIERLMATIIETHHDTDGIVWPMEIAPYKATVLPLNMENPEIRDTAEKIWLELRKKTEVIIDDRDEPPGVKFRDAMLVGIPWQIIIGDRSIKTGNVEAKSRDGKFAKTFKIENAVEEVLQCMS